MIHGVDGIHTNLKQVIDEVDWLHINLKQVIDELHWLRITVGDTWSRWDSFQPEAGNRLSRLASYHSR